MKHQNFHLVTHILCPYVQRSIILLLEKGIIFTRTNIDLYNKPSWFIQKSPMGRVPILLINEHNTLFESAVICDYIDEVSPGSLYPTKPLEKAYQRAWIEYGSGILQSIAKFYQTRDKENFHCLHDEIRRKFQVIEKEIKGTPFFTGENFQMIDTVYAPIFRYFDVLEQCIDIKTFIDLPKCKQWRAALTQRKSVIQAVSKNYAELLITFFASKDSYLSNLIKSNQSKYLGSLKN